MEPENQDSSAMEGFVLDEETGSSDVVDGDGVVVRHRLVYVRDNGPRSEADHRINALHQANITHSQDYRMKWRSSEGEDPQPEPSDVVLETAHKYLAFLSGTS